MGLFHSADRGWKLFYAQSGPGCAERVSLCDPYLNRGADYAPPHYHPNPLLFRSISPHEIPHPLYLKASAEIQFKPDLYSQFFSLKFLKNANVERRGK